jgi:hypothetical protein
MMTPQTSVVPFEFYICDLSGAFLASLGERFVTCDEDEYPYVESLKENMEILLDVRGIATIDEIDEIPEESKNVITYMTHIVMYNMRRALAAARIPLWRRGRGAERSVTPVSGSGGGHLR